MYIWHSIKKKLQDIKKGKNILELVALWVCSCQIFEDHIIMLSFKLSKSIKNQGDGQ